MKSDCIEIIDEIDDMTLNYFYGLVSPEKKKKTKKKNKTTGSFDKIL